MSSSNLLLDHNNKKVFVFGKKVVDSVSSDDKEWIEKYLGYLYEKVVKYYHINKENCIDFVPSDKVYIITITMPGVNLLDIDDLICCKDYNRELDIRLFISTPDSSLFPDEKKSPIVISIHVPRDIENFKLNEKSKKRKFN
jgi:hypothetical protein